MEPIEFPDITTLVINHLLDTLPGDGWDVPVYSEEPNPRPEQFVLVQRIGGARRTIVSDEARIVTDGWAGTDVDAHDLTAAARTRILSMRGEQVDGVQIYRVEDLSGPARNPDPDSGNPRYSTTQSVAARGTTRIGS